MRNLIDCTGSKPLEDLRRQVHDDARFLASMIPRRELEPRAGNAGSSVPEEVEEGYDFEEELRKSDVYQKVSGAEAKGEGSGQGKEKLSPFKKFTNSFGLTGQDVPKKEKLGGLGERDKSLVPLEEEEEEEVEKEGNVLK